MLIQIYIATKLNLVFEGRCYTKGEKGIDEDYIQREITLSLKAKLNELFKD